MHLHDHAENMCKYSKYYSKYRKYGIVIYVEICLNTQTVLLGNSNNQNNLLSAYESKLGSKEKMVVYISASHFSLTFFFLNSAAEQICNAEL